VPYNPCAEQGSCDLDNNNNGQCGKCGGNPLYCSCQKAQSPVNVIFNLNSNNDSSQNESNPIVPIERITPQVIQPQRVTPQVINPERVTPIIATNYVNQTDYKTTNRPTTVTEYKAKRIKENKLVKLPTSQQTKCTEDFYEEFV
jgi:hypothetical protein